MGRGGARLGTGPKPQWKSGKTKTIRVPIALVDEILRFAHNLDERGIIEYETRSKVLDLSRISIRQHQGAVSVHLEDLVKAGFKLQPNSLAEMIKARLARSQEEKGELRYGR
jgi:hypothetical protein